jgi:predicted TIM-barrel fold metal-dependent hydrolase
VPPLVAPSSHAQTCAGALAASTVGADGDAPFTSPASPSPDSPTSLMRSYEEQLAARDRMLDRYPQLPFVALHLASFEWDVDRIAVFLRRFPDTSVDVAARLVHLQLQAHDDRDKVRSFMIAFQDRILYATDLTRLPGAGRCDIRR